MLYIYFFLENSIEESTFYIYLKQFELYVKSKIYEDSNSFHSYNWCKYFIIIYPFFLIISLHNQPFLVLDCVAIFICLVLVFLPSAYNNSGNRGIRCHTWLLSNWCNFLAWHLSNHHLLELSSHSLAQFKTKMLKNIQVSSLIPSLHSRIQGDRVLSRGYENWCF